jgi:integrase
VTKPRLAIVAPTTENRTVTPLRRPNAELRTREHLTPSEVESLMEACKGNRHGHRDATMILSTYRHGLRAAEVVDLRWEQVDFTAATLHVRRVKQGTPATHPLRGDELRALRRLRRDSPESPFLFAKLVERAGKAAALPFGCHPHMLRHACGFALANAGHDTRALQAYLGHRNIQHTVVYTNLASNRFNDFWKD